MGNNRPTLYVGVTNNLVRRVYQHKHKNEAGFTKKYGLDKLLYYEGCESIEAAILREKRLKRWNREWKLGLIKKKNPTLKDMYPEIS